MAHKIQDIAAKTGEYVDGQGQTKGRWQNVGALMQGDDGGMFIIMERWFNPAGVPDPQGKGSVLLSCFPPKDSQQQAQRPPQQNGYGQQQGHPPQGQQRPPQQQGYGAPQGGFSDDGPPF